MSGKDLEIRVLRASNEAADAAQALGNRFDALLDIAASERAAKKTGQAPAGKIKEFFPEEATRAAFEAAAKAAAAAAGNAKGKRQRPRRPGQRGTR